LNCPVPIQYLERVPLRDPKEFNMMRYTAITCDANEFHQKNYTLRQEIMNRETEIAICITMYNVCEMKNNSFDMYKLNKYFNCRKMKFYCQERYMVS
jgi:predicted transcriptional regulator